MLRSTLAAFAVILAGCPRPPDSVPDGSGDPCSGGCTADERCDVAAGACVLAVEPKCGGGTSWTPGTRAFVEATEAWGLGPGVADAPRMSGADVDGDGRVDVLLRRVGGPRNDPSDGGTRTVWLMRNTGSRFEDFTAASSLLRARTPGATLDRPAEIFVFADVDNDGDVDAFTGVNGSVEETSEVMLNDGTGVFSLGPEASDVRVPDDQLGGATFTDVNRDGRIDLWLGGTGRSGAGTQDRLLLGDGAGGFHDATFGAGLETLPWVDIAALNEGRAHTWSWGTAACDLNGDGLPELLSSSYGRSPNHLWVAEPSDVGLSYLNRSVASGYAYDHRLDWRDNESARCFCKLNPGAVDCAGVPGPTRIRCDSPADVFRWNHSTDREPFRLGGNSGTTVCGDVDNDSDLDLLTTGIVHWDVGSSSDPSELLINTGEPLVRFTRPGEEALGMVRPRSGAWNDGDISGALVDFDNDGRLDVLINSSDYPGTRAWLFHQRPNGTFELVPTGDGVDLRSNHGTVLSDFDGDGDIDLFLGHNRFRCESGDHCYPSGHARFFRNEIGHGGNWLQLRLVGGAGSNRSAIGARVTVRTASRIQAFEVGGGHGHYGLQHDLVVHAGLGADCSAEVTVRWPDSAGTAQTFTAPSGYRLQLVQGERPTIVR